MTLRRGQVLSVSILSILALASIAALAGISTRLQSLTDDMVSVTREIRGASDLEMHLRGYYRVPDRRRTYRRQFEAALAEARRHVRTEQGRELLTEVRTTADALFASPVSATFDEAIDTVRSFEQHKFGRLEDMRDTAARWNRIADLLGIGVGLFMVGAIGGFLVWTSGSVIQPILRIQAAMARYASGDRRARAEERGAADVRLVAQEFNSMADALERARNSLFEALARVAHDLRNPLSSIRLNADSIRPGRPLPDEASLRETVAVIARQTKRIDRMVRDLLELSKVEAGGLSIQREPVDLGALVHHVADAHRPTARHRIEVSVPAAEVSIHADPERLEQVLENLVGNAIKYSPEGGDVRISVLERGEEAWIEVADSGPGIAPEDQPHLFEPFRRLESAKGIPGTGMGLAISKALVDAHGGRLEVESAPGRGSTFRIRLPRR